MGGGGGEGKEGSDAYSEPYETSKMESLGNMLRSKSR